MVPKFERGKCFFLDSYELGMPLKKRRDEWRGGLDLCLHTTKVSIWQQCCELSDQKYAHTWLTFALANVKDDHDNGDIVHPLLQRNVIK